VIDLHCHLLPGIDDGPADLAEMLGLARAFVAEGTQTVAATPHVSPHYPRNTAPVIGATRSWVRDVLAREAIALEVVAGAELDLPHVAELAADGLAALALGHGGTVLVECPLVQAAPFFEQRVARIQDAGLRVLLAHPERSPAFLRDQDLLERLVGAGALASVTASSFTGSFGRQARRFAEWALDAELVHDVASDAHNVDRRPPLLRTPLEASGHGWLADWLTHDVPAAILAGAELPPRPDRTMRRLRRRRG
jgi:protein-tyrosine phosphatase